MKRLLTIVCVLFWMALSVKVIAQADEWMPQFVRVEGGKFSMGNEEGDIDVKPVHEVVVHTFYMSTTEVTVGQYKAYCEAVGLEMPEAPSWGWKEEDPMVNVTWHEADAYCKWLARTHGKDYRLPTEAEWEYAVKAGEEEKEEEVAIDTMGVDTMGSYDYYYSNEQSPYRDACRVAIIDSLQPSMATTANYLGIYGLSGQVWEWCQDWYDETYYTQAAPVNPGGPDDGMYKSIRGSYWLNIESWYGDCDLTIRSNGAPTLRSDVTGFRVVYR